MLHSVIVMLKGRTRIVWWVDVDALDFPRELLLQRLEGEEVIPENKTVVEDIVVCDAVQSVVRFIRFFKKDARLQSWPILLPNPGQFKFGLFTQEITSRV